MLTVARTFITTFDRALAGEIAAIQQRYGPSAEVLLANARALESGSAPARLYSFDLVELSPALAPHMECILKQDREDLPVTIVAVDRTKLTLTCTEPIDPDARSHRLVLVPTFLYTRLQHALKNLLEVESFSIPSALRLFGKADVQRRPQAMRFEHPELNTSQQRAIQLCCESNLAWIWGPPGTGKTTTLGHIVAELLQRGASMLITSTTNAAVDQVLARLADSTRQHLEDGHIVRVGQAQGPTFGASVQEVAARRNAELTQALARLETRYLEAGRLIQYCTLALQRLQANVQPAQLDLFAGVQTRIAVDFGPVFSTRHAELIRRYPPDFQVEIVTRRLRRLELLRTCCRTRIVKGRQLFSRQEAQVVREAQVVLTTTATLYLSPLLEDMRFDAVIVEEAGMTILPALFLCACLARDRVVIVGDPRQLPAIVQSDDPFVRRYLGKNIFEIGVSNLEISPDVVMLDVQYRMHPLIGDLVSSLYYHGRLHNDPATTSRSTIMDRPPFAGDALVIIDTEGRTICATQPGQRSRFNAQTARIAVELAVEGVRSGIASIGIITPYAEQSRLIRKLLATYTREAPQIECRTVHRFQGSERDMIILDTVDTAPFSPGVLLSGRDGAQQLVNVSISRARGKLVIIADVAYFRASAPRGAVTEMLEQALTRGQRYSLSSPR